MAPGLLFELLGLSSDLAENYEFRAVELKQVAFRFDGVLLPKPASVDQTVWFVEVQFQDDPEFYHRLFAEIFLYLKLHPQTVDYKAIVIFPSRSIEPKTQNLYRANLRSDQVHRIYLDDFEGVQTELLGVGLMQLIVADTETAVSQAQILLSKARVKAQTDSKIAAIIELIETIMVYKFPQLSREEIERMLGLSELRHTKVYQEALQEGRLEGRQEALHEGWQQGRQEGEQALILRLLSCRIGKVTPEAKSQIQSLSLPELEALGEALLDFSEPSDLLDWLRAH
jgi:predicted transposase/invertase (TIGR01784 family)